MSKSVAKIALSSSRDIPFNRLVLSQANVRRIKAGVSIEELAEDIARRTLLQSLTVRPILDDEGAETGMFEVPAGGRRFRALEILVKQKRLARNALIPGSDFDAIIDSLSEFSPNGRNYGALIPDRSGGFVDTPAHIVGVCCLARHNDGPDLGCRMSWKARRARDQPHLGGRPD